jgi:CIC family chloride channel protein
LVGFLAGLGTVLLKNFTHYIQLLLDLKFFKEYQSSLYFIFPIIGLILVYIIKKFWLKKHIGHGISTTLYAVSKKNGIVERYKIFASLITAPITAGFGGSVGLQGPAVSTGAALGSNVAQLFHMNAKTRMLLIGCATAGAMASMFKAPIAALVFALEVFSLDIAFASLIPLLLASVSAVVTSYFFTGTDVLFRFELVDKFEINDILFYILLGLSTGIASVYFSKMYFAIINFFKRFKNPAQRLIVGALAIGIMLYFIPPLYGEGYGLINNLLEGNHIAAIGNTPFNADLTNMWIVIGLLIGITIFKAIAMTTTFAAGGVGGIFIPTLVMGSTLGNAFAKIINNIGLGFHVSESNFTLIGMTGLMAGVLHAPLTAIFLIAEITGGYELFVPLMLVSAISFALTRYFVSHSIYTMELAQRGELLTHDKDKNTLLLMDLDKIIERDFIAVKPDIELSKMLKSAVVKSQRNIFPVVDENANFLGIVLLDDIRQIMFNKKICKTTSVRNYMNDAPEVIFYEADTMQTIMDKFESSGAWNLPVVKDGAYFGFISKSKMLTAYRKKLIEVTS